MRSLQELILSMNKLIRVVPAIIISLAVVYLFFKLVQAVQSSNSKSQSQLRNVVAYGVLALFVMLFMWGIVQLIQSVFFPGAFILKLGS